MTTGPRDGAGNAPLGLHWLPGRYALCRLAPDAALPGWALEGARWSATRTPEELSLLLEEARLPAALPVDARVERGFAAVRVAGTLPFDAVGILSRLCAALAAASVPVLALSTHDTDVLLFRAADAARAAAALRTVATLGERP